MDLNQLYNLADYFEKSANITNNPNLWILYSFAELHDIFKSDLSNFLGIEISNEEFQEWLNKNKQFEPLVDKNWDSMLDDDKNLCLTFSESGVNQINTYRIYQYKVKEFDFFKIKELILLQKSGNIPNLFLYKLAGAGVSKVKTHLSQEASRYPFIADYLLDLNEYEYELPDPQFNEELLKFVNENKSKIENLLKFSKFQPKFLGSGLDGFVYDIGNDNILKLFQDQNAYNAAIASVNRLHKHPELAKTEAMIYDIGKLGDFMDAPIYYYIMEKMQPIPNILKDPSDLRKIISYILFWIKDNFNFYQNLKDLVADPQKRQELKNEILKEIKEITANLKSIYSTNIQKLEKTLSLKDTWLNSLIEEVILKFLTNRIDLHLGNLGLTKNKELRYFDPSHGNVQSRVNFPGANLQI